MQSYTEILIDVLLTFSFYVLGYLQGRSEGTKSRDLLIRAIRMDSGREFKRIKDRAAR